MSNLFDELVLQENRQGAAVRAANLARINDAIGGYFGNQEEIAKSKFADKHEQANQARIFEHQKELQDDHIKAQKALQLLHNQGLIDAEQLRMGAQAVERKSMEKTAQMRDDARLIREYGERYNIVPTPDEEKDIREGNTSGFLDRAQKVRVLKDAADVTNAGATLSHYDTQLKNLQDASEANAAAFKQRRDAWVQKKASDEFAAQFTPDQLKEIQQRMSAQRGYPITLEKAAADYAQESRLNGKPRVPGFVPLNQIQASAADEFAANPTGKQIEMEHARRDKELAYQAQKFQTDRDAFLKTSPHAQAALSSVLSSAPPQASISPEGAIMSPRAVSNDGDFGGETGAVTQPAVAAPVMRAPVTAAQPTKPLITDDQFKAAVTDISRQSGQNPRANINGVWQSVAKDIANIMPIHPDNLQVGSSRFSHSPDSAYYDAITKGQWQSPQDPNVVIRGQDVGDVISALPPDKRSEIYQRALQAGTSGF